MSNLYSFDESKINWQPLSGVDHARLSILDVDDTAKIVDILFKFSANEKIVRGCTTETLGKSLRLVPDYETVYKEGRRRLPK